MKPDLTNPKTTYCEKIMMQPVPNYDEISDTLYLSFASSEHVTGIELTPHILLRLNIQERKAIGLTFLEYSLLAHKTNLGPEVFRSQALPNYPMTSERSS